MELKKVFWVSMHLRVALTGNVERAKTKQITSPTLNLIDALETSNHNSDI